MAHSADTTMTPFGQGRNSQCIGQPVSRIYFIYEVYFGQGEGSITSALARVISTLWLEYPGILADWRKSLKGHLRD